MVLNLVYEFSTPWGALKSHCSEYAPKPIQSNSRFLVDSSTKIKNPKQIKRISDFNQLGIVWRPVKTQILARGISSKPKSRHFASPASDLNTTLCAAVSTEVTWTFWERCFDDVGNELESVTHVDWEENQSSWEQNKILLSLIKIAV